MTKTKWNFVQPKLLGEDAKPGHFYASSVAEWAVREDPAELIAMFKRERFDFSLWYVPLPIDADYSINYYAPQVEDAKLLGTYKAERRKK